MLNLEKQPRRIGPVCRLIADNPDNGFLQQLLWPDVFDQQAIHCPTKLLGLTQQCRPARRVRLPTSFFRNELRHAQPARRGIGGRRNIRPRP